MDDEKKSGARDGIADRLAALAAATARACDHAVRMRVPSATPTQRTQRAEQCIADLAIVAQNAVECSYQVALELVRGHS